MKQVAVEAERLEAIGLAHLSLPSEIRAARVDPRHPSVRVDFAMRFPCARLAASCAAQPTYRRQRPDLLVPATGFDGLKHPEPLHAALTGEPRPKMLDTLRGVRHAQDGRAQPFKRRDIRHNLPLRPRLVR